MDIGAQLRNSREAKGLTLDALAHTTRVQSRILAAIERNDVSAVPPRPFGRGFVRAYAREIGLDPEQTARDYFAQFAPLAVTAGGTSSRSLSREPASPSRSRVWMWAALAALAVVIIVALASRVTPDAGRQQPASNSIVGTSGAAAASASDTRAAAPTTDVKAPAAARPISSRPLTVVLKTTGRCWMTASADGRRVIYRMLQAGTTETLEADRQITIVAGDAGAVTWTVNGREAGAMGSKGELKTVSLTPATAAAIK